MTHASTSLPTLASLMAQNPNYESRLLRQHQPTRQPLAREVNSTSHYRAAVPPPPAPLGSMRQVPFQVSNDPMRVLKALLKMPEQWRAWGFKLRHIGGLELELRAGFAVFTEDSAVSFPISLVESFILGRRVNSLLSRMAGQSFDPEITSGGSAVSQLCRSMYKECDAWDVSHGTARHRRNGVEVWFVEDDLSVAGFTDMSSVRFELGLLQRWRLWRAARFLSRLQAARELAHSLYRSPC